MRDLDSRLPRQQMVPPKGSQSGLACLGNIKLLVHGLTPFCRHSYYSVHTRNTRPAMLSKCAWCWLRIFYSMGEPVDINDNTTHLQLRSRRIRCLEGFNPQSAKPSNGSPCSNSTDMKFNNIFCRIESWILYISKRLVRNLLSKFAWLVNYRDLQIFAACASRRALALYPRAETSITPGGNPSRLEGWTVGG